MRIFKSVLKTHMQNNVRDNTQYTLCNPEFQPTQYCANTKGPGKNLSTIMQTSFSLTQRQKFFYFSSSFDLVWSQNYLYQIVSPDFVRLLPIPQISSLIIFEKGNPQIPDVTYQRTFYKYTKGFANYIGSTV